MTNLYSKMILEHYDIKYIEDKGRGFITYREVGNNSVYVENIFIDETHRGKGAAKNLVNIMLLKTGAKYLMSHVDMKSKVRDASIAFHLAMGATIYETNSDRIIFFKSYEKEAK